MGAYIYEDPSYALRGVNLRRAEDHGGTRDSLELVFVGCNLNDFDITETSFATRMRIAGQEGEPGDHLQTIYLATRDTSRFSVVVPLPENGLPDRGAQPFEVVARSQVKTPIGDRSIDVRMGGRVERSGEQFNWLMKPQPCKPGSSVLPASFDTRPVPAAPRPQILPGTVNDGAP